MDVFLAGTPLKGARVVVAGEGEAADAKARLFDGSPAEVVRVGGAEALRPQSYAGARLVFITVAEGDAEAAAALARAAGAWVNVVDRPDLCDFTTPAFIDRGAVVGAIATGGAAPLLASELRAEWEARWPDGLGRMAELVAALKGELRARHPGLPARRAWLRRLLDGPAATLAAAGDLPGALVIARTSLAEARPEGRLLALEPPSAPDLLSLRALRALGRADRLVIAEGVEEALLALARRDVTRTPIHQADPQRVAGWVAGGETVVLLGPAPAFQGWGEVQPVAST